MKEKYVITFNSFERDLLINGFNYFRNALIEQDKPIEDANTVLMKLIEAPVLKGKRFSGHEER